MTRETCSICSESFDELSILDERCANCTNVVPATVSELRAALELIVWKLNHNESSDISGNSIPSRINRKDAVIRRAVQVLAMGSYPGIELVESNLPVKATFERPSLDADTECRR